MITFKINGTKFPLPTSWLDVTYRQQEALLKSDNSLLEYIHIFTGIPRDRLAKEKFNNLEKISLALSFLTIPPKFGEGPTPMVGKYVLPADVTIESLGQFEDLRGLLLKIPKETNSIDDYVLLNSLYLEACAIYVQKIRDGKYDYTKVKEVCDELRNYSCMEVTQTGSFFLFRPLNLSSPTRTHFQNMSLRLKRWIVGFPGYQKTLDFLLRSSVSRGK